MTASPATLRPHRFGSPAARLALGFAVAAFCLVTLEAVARVAYTVKQDFTPAPRQWFRLDPQIGWDRQPGFSGTVYGIPRTFDADGNDVEEIFDLTAHPHWPRVVTLGDSCTVGYGIPRWQTWAGTLIEHIPTLNVVNLGVHGHTSYQGLQMLDRHVWSLKPSLLIVSFSYNDRRALLPNDRPDGPERFARIVRVDSTRAALSHSYIARALGRLLGKPVTATTGQEYNPHDPSGIAPPTVDLRTLQPRVSEPDYRANLTAIIDSAQQHNVPVLLLLLRDNPARVAAAAATILDLARAQKWPEAEAALAAYEEADHFDFLIARAGLAQLYAAAGRPADADRIARSANCAPSLHGGMLLIDDAPYAAAMREVAAATGTPLVDAGPALLAQPEVFMDACHVDAEGNRLIAAALAPHVQRLLAEHAAPN